MVKKIIITKSRKRISAGVPPFAPDQTYIPQIAGTVQEGQTVNATAVLPKGSPTITLTGTRWMKDGVAIGGATNTSYPIPGTGNGYAGHDLQVESTFSNGYGSPLTVLSLAVAILTGPPAPPPPPPPPPPSGGGYGATADAGENDDARNATTYNSGTVYYEGNIVISSGTLYIAYKDSQGVSVTDTNYWKPITRVLYLDPDIGNDSNASTVYTDPVAAFNNPIRTLAVMSDLFDTGGTYNASAGMLAHIKRGSTQYPGSFQMARQGFVTSYGTGNRPQINFRNYTGRYFTGNVIECFSGSDGSMIRNIKVNIDYTQHYGFTVGTGTFSDGDSVCLTDGTKTGVVKGDPANGRITIRMDNPSDNWGNSAGFRTVNGLKTGTTLASANRTAMNGLQPSTAKNVRFANIEVYDGLGNGAGSGQTSSRGSADGTSFKNMIVHNCAMIGGAGAGIQGGWGAGIKILNITAYDNGSDPTRAHNLYLDDLDTMEVAYCYAYFTTALGNHAIIVHGNCTGGSIHDNDFWKCRNGIGLNDGYSNAWLEQFVNIDVYRNIIRECGTLAAGDGQPFDLACCVGCRVFNNLVYRNTYVFSVKGRNASGNPATNDLLVAFNTIVCTINMADALIKVVGSTVVNVRFIGNNCYHGSTTQPVFNRENIGGYPPATEILLQANNFYSAGGVTNVISWGGTSYSVSSFGGATNGNTSNQNANPLFTDVSGNVYTLQGGSPAHNATVVISGITDDFVGTSRGSVGAATSQGCYA